MSSLLGALVGNFSALLTTSVLAGWAYAVVTPATNLVIAASVPRPRRGLALGVRTADVPVLAAAGSILATQLGEQIGWRPVLAGVIPLLLATAAVAGRRLPDARSDADAPSATAHLPARFTWFPVACLLLIAGSQPLFSWSMPYLHETIGVALPTAGRLTAVAALTGVASMVLVTWQSDRLAPTARVPTVITLCAVTAASQLLLVILQGAALASVALVPATTAQLADISLMHAAVVEAAPSTVGQASGVTMTGYYLGALLAPPLFGYLVDTTGSFLLPWLCCAVLAVAAAGCFAPCRKVGPRPLA